MTADIKIKCGEIYLLRQDANYTNVSFSCEFCGNDVNNFITFLKHALLEHLHITRRDLTDLLRALGKGSVKRQPKDKKTNDESVSPRDSKKQSKRSKNYESDAKESNFYDDLVQDAIDHYVIDQSSDNIGDAAIEIDIKPEPSDIIEICDIEFVNVPVRRKNLNSIRNNGSHENSLERKEDSSDEEIVACAYCSKEFTNILELKKHEKIHMRSHVCDICKGTFATVQNLRVHRNRHLGIKNFHCQRCDKSFTTNTELKIHVRTHTGEKPYKCTECSRSFSNSSHLSEHLRSHKRDRIFVCPKCGKSFFTLSCLRCHEQTHSTLRPYICVVCQMDFPRREVLNTHMKLHSGKKEYKCEICSKEFAQNAGLFSHMKSHRSVEKLVIKRQCLNEDSA